MRSFMTYFISFMMDDILPQKVAVAVVAINMTTEYK